MLSEQNKSLKDFGLVSANLEKHQCIQNCLADHYVYEEDHLMPEKARTFFEANYPNLNPDQNKVFHCLKGLIEIKTKEENMIFWMPQEALANFHVECIGELDKDAGSRSGNICRLGHCSNPFIQR
jgi:hypothetical protein